MENQKLDAVVVHIVCKNIFIIKNVIFGSQRKQFFEATENNDES